jgi:hypothetical protein
MYCLCLRILVATVQLKSVSHCIFLQLYLFLSDHSSLTYSLTSESELWSFPIFGKEIRFIHELFRLITIIIN